MARNVTQVEGTAGTTTTKKEARPQGPLNLYVIFNEGVDTTAIRGQIAKVTTSMRDLVTAINTPTPAPFITLTVTRGTRKRKDGANGAVVAEDVATVN